jgi:hypothetical protein
MVLNGVSFSLLRKPASTIPACAISSPASTMQLDRTARAMPI